MTLEATLNPCYRKSAIQVNRLKSALNGALGFANSDFKAPPNNLALIKCTVKFFLNFCLEQQNAAQFPQVFFMGNRLFICVIFMGNIHYEAMKILGCMNSQIYLKRVKYESGCVLYDVQLSKILNETHVCLSDE